MIEAEAAVQESRSAASVIATGVVILLLAGCSGTSPERPAPLTIPAPVTTPGSSVPVTSTSPDAVEYALPVQPVALVVESVGIDVPVVPVGVRPDGLMELPERVDVGGWYRYGSWPSSSAGTTVIAAHVDSNRYGLGPFVGLKDLVVGAEIVVGLENGLEQRYRVEAVERFEKASLPVDSLFSRASSPTLVLITCGGQFDSVTRSYSENVVVMAVPVTG